MAKKRPVKQYERCENKINSKPLKVFLAAVPFLSGLYYEWGSAIACIFLLVFLGNCVKERGGLRVQKNILLLASVVIPAMYGISAAWAVDSGMALFGLVKFLPLPVFVLALDQLESEQKENILDYVPVSGALMTVLSGMLSFVPVLEQYFSVNQRLAGFFQYPNTFALYLLIGIVILISGESLGKLKIVNLFVLLVGIILTGSRTGFLLLFLTVLTSFFLLRDKQVKKLLGIVFLGGILISGIYVLCTGNTSSVGRFLTVSFSSSTFLGRILYFKDAFPVILQHPFGLGYLGYYFTQGAFQTGVYSVMNVHNELLQVLLDIGWIPMILFSWAVVKGFVNGNTKNRMVIVLIVLHSMMDFNLQFIVMFLILLAALDARQEKDSFVLARKSILVLGAVLVGGISIYLGTDSALYYLKMYQQSAVLYPGNTNAWMEMLTEAEDVDEMDSIADKILERNPDNPLANNAKSRAAYAEGDFGEMMECKEKALLYYRYNLSEYLDYFNMLYVGYQLYMQNGDPASAEICLGKMKGIPDMLEAVADGTDPLAYEINDKPELELPEEYWEVINALEKE